MPLKCLTDLKYISKIIGYKYIFAYYARKGIIMNFKKIRRSALIFLTATTLIGGAALSGCQIKTDYPEAKITIEFNSETYVLEYKMYRNMYPQTVQRFIELADSNFYDNTIIHDYQSSDWFAGGYTYDATTYQQAFDDGAMGGYLETNSKEKAYDDLFKSGAITPSVYANRGTDGKLTDALSTLIGEFKKNDHKIENGALGSKKGALRMYYSAKEAADELVWLDKTSTGQVLEHDYIYNSATTLFAIQASGTSSLTVSDYCIFAHLKDNDTTALTALQDAIKDYIEEYLDNDSAKFKTTTESIAIDLYDTVVEAGSNEAQFTVTKLPIIIKSVDVVKY